MTGKSNILYIILLILLFISLFFNYKYIYNYNNIIEKTDTIYSTDTLRRVDTLTIFKEKPIPKEVYLTKIDTFYTKDGKDTLLTTENKVYQDTLCNKNDSIILQSYISGQNAQLDSIKADWRKSETIITNTVEITKYIERPKTIFDHMKFGIGVGTGYGLTTKKVDIWFGGTATYTF